MSRGLRNHGATRIDARTNHDAFVNGALQPEHRPTQITHCGETPHQRRLSLSRSQQMKVRDVGGHKKRLGCRRHKRMPMRVDKTRHQHAPIPCNNADIGICVDGDRIHRYSLNLVASNQHIGRSRERGSLTVEDADILKKRDVAASQSRSKKVPNPVLLRWRRLAPGSPGKPRVKVLPTPVMDLG